MSVQWTKNRPGFGINFRVWHDINAKIIRLLPNGTEVEVIDDQFGLIDGITWQLVKVDGRYGWVSKALLSSDKPASTPPVIEIPPEPVPTISGYGVHFLQGATLPTKPYPIYKSVDQPDLLEAAHKLNPSAVCIVRHWYDGGEQEARLREIADHGMEAGWNRWKRDHEADLKRFPYAYFEGYNEVLAPDLVLAFEAYRTRKLGEMNRKACVLNIQPGHTDKDMWSRGHNMVAEVIKYKGIIGEHCYAQAVLTSNANDSYWLPYGGVWTGDLFPRNLRPMDCHTGARIVQSKFHLRNQGQGQAVVVCTELGISDVANEQNKIAHAYGIKTFGWRDPNTWHVWSRAGWLNNRTPFEFYRQQLEWWATETGCLGVIFTHGIAGDPGVSQWTTFDTMGLL